MNDNSCRYRESSGCSLGQIPQSADSAPFSPSTSPGRCVPAASARVQAALEKHAARFPNAKTIAIAVMKASTSEVHFPHLAFSSWLIVGSGTGLFERSLRLGPQLVRHVLGVVNDQICFECIDWHSSSARKTGPQPDCALPRVVRGATRCALRHIRPPALADVVWSAF